jgi:hypothetical protein
MVTNVAPDKLVPVIVSSVPPVVNPDAGEIEEIVGEPERYVNAPTAVAVSTEVTTRTSFVPAVPTGVVTVTEVADFNLIEVAATPPTVTAVVDSRFVPVTVRVSPPAIDPEVTESELIVGSGRNLNV